MKKYSLYVLVKDKKPIYVGCTSNITRRLSYHKRDKNFDTHIVIMKSEDKLAVLAGERAIIKYLSVFGDIENINAKYTSLEGLKQFKEL